VSAQAGIPLGSKGGYIAVRDIYENSFFVLDNTIYEIDSDCATDEYTPSKNGTWATAIHRNNLVTVTVTLPEDSTSSVETGAFVQNGAYDLWLKRGTITTASKRYDCVVGAVFRGIRKINAAGTGQARRLVLTFERGMYNSLQQGSTALMNYLVGITREAS
jgi:hypothetical protein